MHERQVISTVGNIVRIPSVFLHLGRPFFSIPCPIRERARPDKGVEGGLELNLIGELFDASRATYATNFDTPEGGSHYRFSLRF